MQPVNLAHQKATEKSNSRSCCGFTFFSSLEDIQTIASSATDTFGKIVTETGEELSQVASTAHSNYQKKKHLFFVEVGCLIHQDESKLPTSAKNCFTLGLKK